MAKMIGKTLRFRQCPYECCGITQDKHSVKIREKEEAFRFEELATDIHPDGLCQDEKTGMLGCEYCYDDDLDDAYDNSDLDNVERVWCDVDFRNDPYIRELMKEEGLLGEQSQTPRTTPERLVSEITVHRVER